MLSLRRSGAVLGALSLLFIAGCVDDSVVAPEVQRTDGAQLALFDGTVLGGSADFFFLPPTVPEAQAPTLVGEFNPSLSPEIRICELDGGPVPTSSCVATIEDIPTSAIQVLANSYRLDWNPRGENTGQVNSKRYYRAQVIVADSVFGYVDLDPVGNNDVEDGADFDPATYALQFRPRSQTVPIEFFLSVETFCSGEDWVIECITGVAVNNDGATILLEEGPLGSRLGVLISQNSLPAPFEEIVVTLERINPSEYSVLTGEECIPGLNGLLIEGGFDAPQFGDCFRIQTVPELNDPLVAEAVVSICLDVTDLTSTLSLQQIEQLRMVKFSDTNENWTALQETAGDCPTTGAALFDVPESGFMRYAAMGANAVASLIGPTPVEARNIRFGGFNSSFSRFRFALPGEMVPTAGDGIIIQPGDDNSVAATITVLDAGDNDGLNRQPVEGARVRFEAAAGSGSVDMTEVVTGADGTATVQWTVDPTPGDKTLTASAFGLFGGPLPDPDGVEYDFVAEDVTFTATVVGAPSQVTQDPLGNIDDAVAGSPETLSVIVLDSNDNQVVGATVTWQCTPTCTFGEGTQNPDGSATATSTSVEGGVATIEWTPLSAGSQLTAVADINEDSDPEATFTATVAPAPAAAPTFPTVPATSTAGLTLDAPLVITVTDEYGNPRVGDAVTWTLGENSGTVSSTSTNVGIDGTTQIDWTISQTADALNTLTVAVDGTAFSTLLSVTGTAGEPVQPTGAPTTQSGVVGTALGTALTVTVTDQFGNPIEGETVTWATSDGGSFTPASVDTDSNGQASTSWTLGGTASDPTDPASDPQTAVATIGDFTVDFSAVAAPGDPNTIAGSGGGITQTVGSTAALTATVTDSFGNAVPGAEVSWGGTGEFSAPTSTTGTDGIASITWTLATLAGAQSASASVVGFDGVTAATYSATATPDVAASIEQTGAGGEYEPGTALPLSITVKDQYGNALDGDAVSWSTGSGSVPGDAATANGGVANATWTLGSAPGDVTATAMVGGLTATFNARVLGCLVSVDGTLGVDEWNCDDVTFEEFTANVDGGVPAELYTQQRDGNIYFLVRVQQSPLDRVNDLRIDFDNTLDGASADDDAIGYRSNGGFYDEYLTQQCVNRGQAGCGATDSNGAQGAGASDSDGTWTVFELSHPLNGDGVEDINRSVGQQFGFFLTFQNGNGAKGNTQFPGFRDFRIVTVQ